MIHIKRITRRYNDPHAPARKETTARLANEMAEERVSRELVERHNRHVRDSAAFRQQGGP